MDTNGLPKELRDLLERLSNTGFEVVNLGDFGELPPQFSQMFGEMGGGPRRESRGNKVDNEETNEKYDGIIERMFADGVRVCPSCGKATCSVTIKLNQLADKKLYKAIEEAVGSAVYAAVYTAFENARKAELEERRYNSFSMRFARWRAASIRKIEIFFSYVPDVVDGWNLKMCRGCWKVNKCWQISTGRKHGIRLHKWVNDHTPHLSSPRDYVSDFMRGWNDEVCVVCPVSASCPVIKGAWEKGTRARAIANRMNAHWKKTSVYAFIAKMKTKAK